MIYPMNSPYIGGEIDRYVTGNYGEDYFADEPDEDVEECSKCQGLIFKGNTFYRFKNVFRDTIICENCLDEYLDDCREVM